MAINVAGLGLGYVDYVADTITLDVRAAGFLDLPAATPLARDALHARIHPEDRPAIDERVDALLLPDGTGFIDVEHRVQHRDGREIWVSARKQVVFSANLRPAICAL